MGLNWNHTAMQKQKPRKISGICGLWEINMFHQGIGEKGIKNRSVII
jgi:hypothetical protein